MSTAHCSQIKLPSGETVDALLVCEGRCVQRSMRLQNETIFTCIIQWREGDPLDRWTASLAVSGYDGWGTRRGVWAPRAKVMTASSAFERAITDPDKIMRAIVQLYVDRHPDGPPASSPPKQLRRMTHDLTDHGLGEIIGWAWTAGVTHVRGYGGHLVQERDLDELASATLDCVPGFAAEDGLPSDGVLEGLRHALDDAGRNGIIQFGADERRVRPWGTSPWDN